MSLQQLSLSLLEQFEKDLEAGIFKEYKTFTTSLNVEVKNIEEAIKFNSFHEGLHLGYVLALKRLVKNNS